MESNQSVTEKAKFGSVAKTLQKTSFKKPQRVPMLLSFVDLSTKYCPKSSPGTYFVSNSTQTSWNLHFWHILVFPMSHSLCKLTFKVSELQERPKFDRFQEAPIYQTALYGQGQFWY